MRQALLNVEAATQGRIGVCWGILRIGGLDWFTVLSASVVISQSILPLQSPRTFYVSNAVHNVLRLTVLFIFVILIVIVAS